jgi:hypothetical protein
VALVPILRWWPLFVFGLGCMAGWVAAVNLAVCPPSAALPGQIEQARAELASIRAELDRAKAPPEAASDAPADQHDERTRLIGTPRSGARDLYGGQP